MNIIGKSNILKETVTIELTIEELVHIASGYGSSSRLQREGEIRERVDSSLVEELLEPKREATTEIHKCLKDFLIKKGRIGMSNLVKIPKWFLKLLESTKSAHKKTRMEIICENLSRDDLDEIGGLVVVARAIEEGYEIEKEHFTLEQVMELPSGTMVSHEMYEEEMRVSHHSEGAAYRYLYDVNHADILYFEKWMLEPKWYVNTIVDKEKKE